MAFEPICPKPPSPDAHRRLWIDFCDFWPGFRKTDNFFYHTLKLRFEVEITDQPEYVIYADAGRHVHRLYNCVRIHFGVEPVLPDWSECDYALSCHYLNDPRHLRLPFYAFSTTAESLVKSNEDPEVLLAAKTRFCAFVVSNVGKHVTQKRVEFFHRLSKYKRVDSGGRAFNNIGGPLPHWMAKLEFLRTCKFNVAFENRSVPGYTTEKPVEAMQARCVPIYWGSPRVQEEFNTKSFLNYFDFPNEEALIERIIELDRDDAKYLEIMRQPYFHNNQPNEFFNADRLLDFFERIVSTPIRPVSQQRRLWQLGRWLPAKLNRPHGPSKG
jgi:alpha(1,3/1,4) fucosyltransferase